MVEDIEEEKFSIIDLVDKNSDLVEQSNGNYKMTCPDCGLQGGRTKGFILFPETNGWYCHSSGKHGGILEFVAMDHKLIKCLDCLEKGEKRRVLEGELFKETLDILKEEYDEETYNNVVEILKLRKPIKIPGENRLVSDFADDLGVVLKNKETLFYRSDLREVVEIGKIKQPSGKEIDNGFIIMRPNRFITLIERYFKPWTEKQGRNGKYGKYIVNQSMNSSHASNVLASSNFQDKMPVINRIFPVQIPIIHEGKLTFPNLGYDKKFGSWLPHNAPKIENPEMSLEEAKKILNSMYHEFCFKGDQDYTNSIAALITPALRGLFPSFNTRTPIFFYVGNRERAGKDYNAGITGIVYEGQALEEPPISTNEKSGNNNEETRKKIMSALIQGRKRFHSSNNKGLINNAVFESISTAESYSDRILGKSEILNFDNELDFSLSGNIGTSLTPDLANRSIYINLFLEIEDANKRKFNTPNLHQWVKKNRGVVLSSIYVLIRNWFNKGCPKGTIPFASFPVWAEICGGIMETAGLGNPCNRSSEDFGIAMDSETEDMKNIFEVCYEDKHNQWMKKTDIKEVLKKSHDLNVYIDWDRPSDWIKISLKIDKFVGRILSDIKLLVKDPSIRASRRQYMFVVEKAEKEAKNFSGHTLAISQDILLQKDSNKLISQKGYQKSIQKLSNEEKVVGMVGNGNVVYSSQNSTIGEFKGTGQPLPNTTIPTTSKVPPEKPQPQKSDREVQFFEAEECKDIKPNHTKEDVLKWIKDNPSYSVERLYEKFGVGCLKFRNELQKESLI